MAFVSAVNRYGVWGDHGPGDSLAVMYSSGATQRAGVQTGTRQICISLNPVDAAITIQNSSNCNHWAGTYNSGVDGFVGQKLNIAVETPTSSGKI